LARLGRPPGPTGSRRKFASAGRAALPASPHTFSGSPSAAHLPPPRGNAVCGRFHREVSDAAESAVVDLIRPASRPARLAELIGPSSVITNGTAAVAPLARWISRLCHALASGCAPGQFEIGVAAPHCRVRTSPAVRECGGCRGRASLSSEVSSLSSGLRDQGVSGPPPPSGQVWGRKCCGHAHGNAGCSREQQERAAKGPAAR